MSDAFARSGECPSCGAQITFPFAGARAQVCRYCRFVVVRTDRGFTTSGRVADVLPLASRFGVGGTGLVEGERFRVAGRVQYEREEGSAPWQEFFLELASGSWIWIAEAQGRTYRTALVPDSPPPAGDIGLGWTLTAEGRVYTFAESGTRRLVAAEGELPFPVGPDQIERYVDISGKDGAFGTIDYGDGSSPPLLFLGHRIEPSQVTFDPGSPASAPPEVSTTALTCPGCGGDLPLLVPGATERIVCRYCGMQSDLNRGALVALKKVSLPGDPPVLPIGSRGTLGALHVLCVGYLDRSTVVDGEVYPWREYLLHAGDSGYVWLVEEAGEWQVVTPIDAGDVTITNGAASFKGERFGFVQTVVARVDEVVGEFYWKVETSETVNASEYQRGSRKLNLEATPEEVVWSSGSPASDDELAQAFPDVPHFTLKKRRRQGWRRTWGILLIAWILITAVSCATSPATVLFTAQVPPPAAPASSDDPSAPDSTYFSAPFTVPEGKHRVRLELIAPNLSNSWVAASCALVNETTGEVFEAELGLEYYSGVEGGESWSEGSHTASTLFAGVPGGSYVTRVDASGDPTNVFPNLTMEVVCDPFRWIPSVVSFLLLFAVWFFGRRSIDGATS